jgi:hypothetical protein
MSLLPGLRRGIRFYIVVAICCGLLSPDSTNAFEFYDTGSGGGGGRPTLDRRAMAGLWKLTPLVARQYPMKEFTVYPKKKPPPGSTDNDDQQLPELLLMLKEDGSFQRYDMDADADNEDDDDLDDGDNETISGAKNKINQSWIKFQQRREQFANICTGGTWDFLDGNLLLAADRIDETSYHVKADGGVGGGGSTLSSSSSSSNARQEFSSSSSSSLSHKTDTNASTADTLLKGRVVAKYQPQLSDNPTAFTRKPAGDGGAVEATTGSSSTNSTTAAADRTTGVVDTHLSVPMGTINIGKFFYPKKHPSFFEQPMFRPIQKGSFALRQVLGPLSMQKTDSASQTKPAYQRVDFYNKTFLLTSSPIPPRSPPAGEQRWSIKYNKYVQDPPKLSKKSNDNDDAAQQSANIRVMEVAFYQNNTFCSIAGLGQSAILRGKFDVIGKDKDQIWFQIVRFGFGRSVSGSVYSEGRMLSHEDAKAYWGTIHRMDENDPTSRLEVRGSVLLGWGLEPLPVARFIMRETETGGTEVTLEEEEEDEEDDDDKSIETIEKLVQNKDGDDSDWVSPESSFQ